LDMNAAERQKRFRERQKLKEHVSELLTSLQSSGENPGRALERACFATIRGALIPNEWRNIENFAADRWADDLTPLVLRAASAPSMTTDSAMQGILQEVVADFVASLAPMSAAARLFAEAVSVSLDGIHTIKLPQRSGPINLADVPWIAEGAGIPVPMIPTDTSITLGPTKKLASIVAFTRELAERSNAEAIFTTLLRETAALQLDTSVFSNQAATAARPAGILAGVSALPGSAVMDDDLGKLANAIGTVTTGLAYIAHPNQANAIRLRKGATWPADIPLWPTIGVAPGTVIALDPAALMTAFGGAPTFDTSQHAMLQLNNPVTENTLVSPTRSLFQTDSRALRLLLDAAYGWRMDKAVAWVTGTTW
jgi:hypothetical protein